MKALAEYEADLADTNRFVGRLVLRAVFTILVFISGVGLLSTHFYYMTSALLNVSDNNTCQDLLNSVSGFFHSTDAIRAVMLMGFAFISEAAFFVQISNLVAQCYPNRYRERINKRIARLRRRGEEDPLWRRIDIR